MWFNFRSGKSTLMVALFRIEKLRSGEIFIDGIDIGKVPLIKLRKKLGIIPQVGVSEAAMMVQERVHLLPVYVLVLLTGFLLSV